MRFIVDECTGPTVARWLREEGHDVLSVYDDARGSSGDVIIRLALAQNPILVTNDKDFGEMVFRQCRDHHGVVLLRLDDESAVSKIAALKRLLSAHIDKIADCFVVVADRAIRFAAKTAVR